MEKTINIPVSETLSFLRFESKTRDFIKAVVDRHHKGDLGYVLDFADGNKLIIKDENDICKGSVYPLGIYGYYEESNPNNDNENSTDQNNKKIYHWTWIWSLPEDDEFRVKFNNAGLDKIQALRDELKNNSTQDDVLADSLNHLFNNANVFSEDGMINSYIESVLAEKLSLDAVYNIVADSDRNLFLALGVTDIKWYNPVKNVDIISINDNDNDNDD